MDNLKNTHLTQETPKAHRLVFLSGMLMLVFAIIMQFTSVL